MQRRHRAGQDFPAEAIAHQDKLPAHCGDPALQRAAVAASRHGHDAYAKVPSNLLRSVGTALSAIINSLWMPCRSSASIAFLPQMTDYILRRRIPEFVEATSIRHG